jgi:DegV family protein with EDD domain
MGFVRMVEGMVRLIHGDPLLALPAAGGAEPAPVALVEVAAERDFQYCTEVLVRGEQLPPANEVRGALHALGGSIVAIATGDILKVHVHTDTPEAVFSLAARWGTVETTKAEDMRVQHRRLAHAERRPVAVVTDSSADLPDTVLDRHRIALVPLQVMFGDETFRDRVELRPEEFYRRLRIAKELPTTSQPTPGDFVRVFRDVLQEADEIVAVLLSAGLSGTYQSAQAAVRSGGLGRVHLVDSASASLGAGMLALRAAELAESGWRADDIAAELRRLRSRSGVFITVDRYDNLIRSGRVSRGKAWLGGMLDVRPILSLNAEGRVVPVDRVRGRENVVPRVLSLLERRLTPRPRVVRFGVAHADAPETAERVRTALVAAYRPRDCFVTLATGVLGTHVGPGAWGVFYQVEDGTPTRLDQGQVGEG